MAIDRSGDWWVGDGAIDIHEYLLAYSAAIYKVQHFRLARCECGSEEFGLEFSDAEGVVRRTCAQCGEAHFICDSEMFWRDADIEVFQCPICKSSTANVGVGFSLDEEEADIRWIYVGVRCAGCGVLGCVAGWKVGYGPSLHLMGKV